jgi:two-component system, sensor histidine kinase and response regulator
MSERADEGAATSVERPARLLVVDDEPAQRKALCDTLRTEGYDTAGFATGQSALDALRPGHFDLLLTDLAMPGMDGIALLKAAQRVDPDLVGIVMTGEGTITSAVEAMQVGALDYILKPFKLSAILPVLGRALSVRRLRRENGELSRRLSEHAAELEAANRELDSFTHSVSHDLRAPLRAVIGFADLLGDGFKAHLPAKGQELLAHVIRAARGMDQLIDDLLRFSRAGQQAVIKRPVDLTALVKEVLRDLHDEQASRDVEVVLNDLPAALADRALLKQVFANLLSNAFKFTRKTGRAVVEVGCRDEAGQRAYFVRDNGAGFDMQYAKRLFGVFQRMHRADEFEGTGVGLSIAHRIVQRHGGHMWVDAAPNRGATFYFSLRD